MKSNFSEEDESAASFGARGKRSGSKMLEFRLKTGVGFAIGYHWMQSLSLTPDHRIEIIFSTHEITIEGRNLKELYRGLIEHRVPFIQEGDALYDQSPQTEPFVSGITVSPR